MSDKIGIAMEGKLEAIGTHFVGYTMDDESSSPVHLSERKLEYFSVWVAAEKVEERGTSLKEILGPWASVGNGSVVTTDGDMTYGGLEIHTLMSVDTL